MDRTMLSPRWRKVLRDLWGNKPRTILVVLSIAVGIFAVGMIAGSQVIFTRELNTSWESVNPASATLYTSTFDDELVATVRNMPEVKEADGRRGIGVRFKDGPLELNREDNVTKTSPELGESAAGPVSAGEPQVAGTDRWQRLSIYAYPDYEDIRIFQVSPEYGDWPPPDEGLLIERSSLRWMGVEVGDVVTIEVPNGRLRELPISGVVHDLTQMDASWTGMAAGYVSAPTLEWLGVSQGFDEMNIIVAEKTSDKEHISQVAQMVRDRIEKSGRTVYYTWVPTPGKHPADEVVQPILLLMGALGTLALLVSGFLVFNTLQALLTQQVRQIGIMKAVGARARQIIGVYYGMVLIYGLLSLAVAVPLGALAGNAMTQYMAGLINFDVTSWELPPRVYALEVAVGLLVPVLAALYPIISGVRTTAREAMSDYGLSTKEFGQGAVDRLLERIRGLSRPLLLSLRNTFRRKGRLVLTLTTLTLGGAIFIAVFSIRASLLTTLDDMFDYVQFDAYVGFRRGYRVEKLEEEALKVPGVVAAEGWRFASPRRLRPDDTEGETISLRAARPDSELVHPTILEGRWLLPDDENAIVVNTLFIKEETDVKVGDEIVLAMDGDETPWRVVGLMTQTPPIPMAYVNFDYFVRTMGGVGKAGVVFVQTERHDAAYQEQMEKALEEHFEALGMQVGQTMTASRERAQIETQFDVLVGFLLVMAILLAFVGAIGLMGTMSLNVLERIREIGVLRAIGASDGAVLRIVIVEGVLIGVLSWLIGTVLAYPLSKALSDAVGVSILQAELTYAFSTGGMVIWLGSVVVLSALASFVPARNASRITVREVLAYE
jgi:putative ABC transport system permease protein